MALPPPLSLCELPRRRGTDETLSETDESLSRHQVREASLLAAQVRLLNNAVMRNLLT